MRVLDRCDPRWAALLLVPVLLLAGAVQAPPPVAGAAVLEPTRAGLLLLRPMPLLEPVAAPVAAQPQARGEQRLPAALPVRRASRSTSRSGAPAGPQERGQAALDALDYDWRALGYRVSFVPYTGGTLGSANRVTRKITIRVRPSQSELSLRATIAHELGHALDFGHGTQQRRDDYRRLRGLPGGSTWFPCSGCDDLRSPAGDFAEVFAAWLVGTGDFRSRVKGPPTQAELRRLGRLFRLPSRPAPAPAQAASVAEPAPEPEPSEDPDDALSSLLDPSPPPRWR